MPSSRPDHIPLVIGIVRQLRPRSILELGVGFGKWGHLFREYTDIVAAEADPPRYRRENWRVRIDGIEGHGSYITPAHEYLYDRIMVGDMREVIHRVGRYDLVFLGDSLEHVTKHDGRELLQACLDHADLAVLVTTPARATGQQAACGNPLEVHRSLWQAADFAGLGRCLTCLAPGKTLLALLLKPGVPAPQIEVRHHRRPWLRRAGRLVYQAISGRRESW